MMAIVRWPSEFLAIQLVFSALQSRTSFSFLWRLSALHFSSRHLNSFVDDKFCGDLTSVISYLLRQQNLIRYMRNKFWEVKETLREYIITFSAWFKLNKITVNKYFEFKMPSCLPSPPWWVQIIIIYLYPARATITFKQIQGHFFTV